MSQGNDKLISIDNLQVVYRTDLSTVYAVNGVTL